MKNDFMIISDEQANVKTKSKLNRSIEVFT